MNRTPNKKDLLYNKFLAIAGFIKNATDKINKGHYMKGKEYLTHALKDAENGMELLRSIGDEKDIWHE